MSVPPPIATGAFVLVSPDGRRTPITVKIGWPYAVDANRACCPVGIEGLDGAYPDMEGVDTLQALCLAVGLVRTRLRARLEQGDTLLYADDDDDETGIPVDLDAHFAVPR